MVEIISQQRPVCSGDRGEQELLIPGGLLRERYHPDPGVIVLNNVEVSEDMANSDAD